MRKKIVAGNWKMNLSMADGQQLVKDVISRLPLLNENQQVIFCPPFTHLHGIHQVIEETADKSLALGAQNCHAKSSGAYTGEISLPMLLEAGVEYIIIGHSERRQYFNETNEILKEKVDAIISTGKKVIFCCGEPLSIREANTQNEYVSTQLKESLFHLTEEQMLHQVVIAYEPIWAIGTGMTASTEQAQEMHSYLRGVLSAQYTPSLSQSISILYGGSCNDSNAVDLFACEDVDGGLIGGAALKAETFLPILFALPS